MLERAKGGGRRERVWDVTVRELWDVDGCGVLGARAIAVAGLGARRFAAAAVAAAAEASAAQPQLRQQQQQRRQRQHKQQCSTGSRRMLAFSSCIRLQEISARSGSSIGVGSRE